jgi:hypothetical protein
LASTIGSVERECFGETARRIFLDQSVDNAGAGFHLKQCAQLNASCPAANALGPTPPSEIASLPQDVERRMLFRIGDETARYLDHAPCGRQPLRPPRPSGRRRISCAAGTFQHDRESFAGSSRAPGGDAGRTVLVKRWQFRSGDRACVVRVD